MIEKFCNFILNKMRKKMPDITDEKCRNNTLWIAAYNRGIAKNHLAICNRFSNWYGMVYDICFYSNYAI